MSEWEAVRVQMRGGGDWLPLDGNGVVWNKLTIIEVREGGAPEVHLDVEVGSDGVPECREVRLSTVGAGRSVRSRDLRAVRFEVLLETGFGMAVMQRSKPPEFARRHGVTEDDWVSTPTRAESGAAVRGLRSRKKRKVDDALLREVASVYRANVDRSPTQAVAERFGKRPSTAALYVKTAREQTDPETGKPFLGAALKGKAGEK